MGWQETEPMQERMRFMVSLESGLYTMSELCGRFGVSRKTGYKWARRYMIEGVEGLRDRSRAPKHCPHRSSELVVDALVGLRHQHPLWGPRKLLAVLKRQQPDVSWPGRSTAGDILRRHGLVKARRRQRKVTLAPAPPFEPRAANELWSVDFKGHFKLLNGQTCYPLTVADGFSRYLLTCRSLHSTARAGVEPQMDRLFQEYGMPGAILSDNGPPFGSIALCRLSRISVRWIKLGIQIVRITPGHPEQNGRHERMHRTLKAHTAHPPCLDWESQQRAFTSFRHEFNEERPHEALDDRVPSEMYAKSPRAYPSKIPAIEYPAHFEVRRVRFKGDIKWRSERLFVSEVLTREYVGLEEIDDGIWSLYFGPVLLARLDESNRELIS